VSRFFQALEQAERDRAADETAAAHADVSESRPSAPVAAPDQPVVPPSHSRRALAGTSREPMATGSVDGHLVSLLAPATFEAEQYRGLRHLIEARKQADGMSVVAVSSAAVGDGKTVTAINLAGALAQRAGARILLIDADLRRPSVARELGLRTARGGPPPGLVDAIVEPGLSLDDVRCPCPEFNLDVVPAGGVPETPYELLQSPRFAVLLGEARRRYDVVVLDTPPLVAVPDGRVLEKLVDGILLVVSAHQTPRRLVEEALSLTDPAKALGIVFNRDDRPLSGYYRGYHDGAPRNGHARSRWSRMLRRGPGPGAAD
jgi:capsular exopolysaccharide synthesis family protein